MHFKNDRAKLSLRSRNYFQVYTPLPVYPVDLWTHGEDVPTNDQEKLQDKSDGI